MSRHEVIHKDKGLAYGKDHACGEFLMIWKRPIDLEERKNQDKFGPDPEEIIVDKDTMFHKDFNKNEMIRLIELHGFELQELEDAYNKAQEIQI